MCVFLWIYEKKVYKSYVPGVNECGKYIVPDGHEYSCCWLAGLFNSREMAFMLCNKPKENGITYLCKCSLHTDIILLELLLLSTFETASLSFSFCAGQSWILVQRG